MSGQEDDVARATTPMFEYSDGSGFEMSVRVTKASGDAWEVGIRCVNQRVEFDAERWPALRDEIDRLLGVFANQPGGARR